MEIIYPEKYVAPLEIEGLPGVIARVELTPGERKQISASRATIATVDQIGLGTCPPAVWNQFKCALQDAEQAAWKALSDAPSTELAEQYNAAHMRLTDAEKTGELIGDCIRPAHDRATAVLLEVANGILDRAKEILDAEADRHRQTIDSTVQDAVFGLGDAFENRVRAVTIAVDVERSRAKREPSQWLAEHGFLDQAAPPAKK